MADSVSQRLQACGLDPAYWSGVLRAAFDITNLNQVGELGKDDVDKLMRCKQSELDQEAFNRFIASARESSAERSDTLSQRLEECGLDPVYWSGVLRAAFEITSLDQVGKLGKDDVDKLMRCKQSELDLEALNRFIASTRESSAERSVTLSQRLEECGLDPVYWSGVLRAAFEITSLDQVGKLGKDDVDKLMRCKQSELDLEALNRFIASARESSAERSVTLSQRLEECGLDPVYWSGVLRAAFEITSLDQVGKLGKDDVDKLMRCKQSELDLEALNRFIASTRESSAERSVTLSQRLEECGLDPVYWSGVLRAAFEITSLDQVGKLGKDDVDKLMRCKQSELDLEALNRFIASARESSAERSVTLSQRLEECGLDPVYWSGVLRAAFEITSLDQVGKLGKDDVDKLMRCKQSELDLEALNRFIASARESSAERSVTLSQRLEECGLDPVYWSGVLRAAFEITSLDQVGKLGKDDVNRLMRCKQCESELEALNRFIDSSNISNIGFIETLMDKSERKGDKVKLLDRVKLLVHELFELNEATETRAENDVQTKADELFQALDIPKDNWLKEFNQETVATAIVSLSADLQKLVGLLSTKNDFNTAQVLDNANDGVALRGLLPNEKREYQLCPEKLLSASCRPKVSIPQNCQETIEVVHTSKKDFQEFNETLKMSGFIVAAKMKAGSSGGGSAVDQEREVFYEGTDRDVHFSKTMCVHLLTMTVDFRETEFCPLSTRALKELKHIDKLVADGADELLKSKCKEFLKMFGSHFHLGCVLGGILKLDVVYSSSLPLGLSYQAIVDMVNDIYNAILSSSFLGPLPPRQIEGFMNEEKLKKLGLGGTYDPYVLSKVSIQVERCGGSGDVESIPLWKASLGPSGDIICFVVESDPPELCAIWDLLSKTNFEEIQHPQKIAVHLLQVSQSQFFASPGSPITQALGPRREEVAPSLISVQPGTGTPGDASSSYPRHQMTQPLESDKNEPGANPTSNPLSLGTPGEASSSSQEAGPHITQTLRSEKKEIVGSPVSNPADRLPAKASSSAADSEPQITPASNEEYYHKAKQLNTPPGRDIPAWKPLSSKAVESQIRSADRHDPCSTLLSQLCLNEYYPQKISLKHVVSITEGQEEKKQLKLPDIPWVILRKILMINYQGRNTAWEGRLSVSDGTNNQSDDVDVLGSSLEDLDADAQGNSIPHPIDIFLATFICCDLMLRQVLLEKMTKCRLSVPLVMPGLMRNNPTLCKWALRSVVLEYCRRDKPRSQVEGNSPGPMVEFALVDCPMKVVSFVRIGEISISKSQLLNGVLSAQSHHTFFNKESCSLGTSDRSLSNGLIEATWYIPSKRDEGLFDDVTMFLNLRGDSASFPDQAKLINTVSSVVTVFVDINDLASDSSVAVMRTLNQRNQKFVLVVTGTTTHAKGCVQRYGEKVGEEIMSATTKTVITTSKGQKQKTLIEIGEGIRQKLSLMLKEGSAKTYEELSQIVCKDGIRIDEDDEECQQGKELAGRVSVYMEGIDIAAVKEEQLPIQKLWPDWSKLLKEQNRMVGVNREVATLQEREKLHEEMQRVRKKQAEKCTILSPVLQTFSTTLIKLIDKPRALNFYLQWLKFFFDQLSRERLPGLRQEYNRCWAKFNRAKSQPGDDQSGDDLSQLKVELQRAERKLAEASCGLEHLFREIGQLYEANKESKVELPSATTKLVDQLPVVAAKLILLGHPIELMDGDAANVPLTWVKEVLTSLATLTGDKRVFVLSVLGIQSSGKSTLLNTMFGLRFAVSAGRCTRGVYAQLVDVDKAKTDLPVDYILVVDTEGLRAPELSQDKHEHDNELATLAIGLGDVVILNIKGENVAEMKDVLQIAVHAFLRMKRVDLHQTCVFIHQNVSAINANEKMLHGQQNLLDNLNEMTEQAAEQEELKDIHSFNQIINLDVEKCVWYFSDLWQGDPPMAPTNPGYSESVDNMRKCLLFDIVMSQKNKFLSVSHLTSRINDLWKGILADNFVFSFRNSLAVKAYSGLEDKYHEVTWVIEKSINKWFSNTAQNKLERCETEKELETASLLLINELKKEIGDLTKKQKDELEKFFEQNALKDITIQWKDAKVHSVLCLAEDLGTKTTREINQKKNRLGFDLRNRAEKDKHDKEILEKASELADEMKGKSLTDETLDSAFNEMWTVWLGSLAPPDDWQETPIWIVVEGVLYEKFSAHNQHLNREVKLLRAPFVGTLPGDFSVRENDIHQVKNIKDKFSNFFMGKDFEKFRYRALGVTEGIFTKIEGYLSNLISQGTDFQPFHAKEVVKAVIDFVDTHNLKDSTQLKFTFLPEYKVRLAVHVCRRAISVFTEMREDYDKKHSPAMKLKNMKNTAFNLFKNKVRNCANELTAAELFCDHLAELIKQKITGNMAMKIYEVVYNDFSKKKYHLIVAILEDLASRNGFAKGWGTFLKDSKTCALRWMTRVINKKCFSPENRAKNSSYASIAGSALNDIIRGVGDSVKTASRLARRKPSSGGQNINEWMQTFCNVAEKYLAVREIQMKPVVEQGVEDIGNFEKLVLKRLDETKREILKGFHKETKKVKWEGETPYQLVIDKLWGCDAQCPFCKEPCQWTDADHCKGANKVSHKCIQHRCQGLGGWRPISGTNEGHLVLESCSYTIQTPNERFTCQKSLPSCKGGDDCHYYKMYKTYYPDWDIAPSSTMESSKFWMWVMATYKKELAELYHAKEALIPESWTEITKEEALRSLRESL